MSTEPSSELVGRRNRWRFGVRDIIWIQLLMAPAFLAPVYARHQAMHPYLQLFAFLLAPVCYVVIGMVVAPSGDIHPPPTVIANVCRGTFYGVLFGSLSLVPVIVYEMSADLKTELHLLGDLYNASVRDRVWGDPLGYAVHLFSAFAPFVFGPLFYLLLYGLIGAATAGVAGIARDWVVNVRRVPAAQ